jgi:hypothetical protein
MLFRCLVIAGTLTPNNAASARWVSQAVSSWNNTPTFTAPSGAL